MVSHEKGDILFHENDEARHFYILLNGHVKLSVGGEGGQVVYDVGQNGEAFGWSSLIGREVYSASAECVQPTKLLVSRSPRTGQSTGRRSGQRPNFCEAACGNVGKSINGNLQDDPRND